MKGMAQIRLRFCWRLHLFYLLVFSCECYQGSSPRLASMQVLQALVSLELFILAMMSIGCTFLGRHKRRMFPMFFKSIVPMIPAPLWLTKRPARCSMPACFMRFAKRARTIVDVVMLQAFLKISARVYPTLPYPTIHPETFKP